MGRSRSLLLSALGLGLLLLGAGSGEDPLRRWLPPRPERTPVPASARGCGCAHSCRATTYQGCGCGALSCFPGGSKLTSLASDPEASQALRRLEGPAPCVSGLAAGTFPCHSVDLEGYVALADLRPGAASGSNLWGFQDLADEREYVVVGVSNGTSVVEVTDPAHPRVVRSIEGPESNWREVKVHQTPAAGGVGRRAFAYVVSEGPTAGLQILDLSALPDSVALAGTLRVFDTSHTVTIANVDPSTGAAAPGGPAPVLYVQGARQPTVGVFALGLSNPVEPAILGQYTLSYGHDTWAGRVSGGRAEACEPGHDPCDLVVVWTGGDIRVLDWTEKAAPAVIAQFGYTELGYAHSGWVSSDGNFLFSMDELDEKQTGRNSRVRIFDVRDWRHPLPAGEWEGPTPAIEHNGYTVGDRYILAHYERGLTVLDVSHPLAPIEEGFFDTYPASDTANYHGSWGVYPFLPSGTIALSNIDGAAGLFLVKANRVSGDHPRDPILRIPPPERTPRVVDAPRGFP
jgi:choice-of-anchor B domain-containing protein